MRSEYDRLYEQIGHELNLEPWLLKGVAQAESAQVWMAYRHGAGERRFYKRRIRGKVAWAGHRYYHDPQIIAASWGLMQVMYTTAAECGFPREGDWWDLLDPETNIRLGGRYLKQKCDRYGNISAAVSAYNAGIARIRPEDGKFQNQPYVDRVMRLAERFRTDWPSKEVASLEEAG